MNKEQIYLFKEEMKYYVWLKDTIVRLKEKADDVLYEMTGVKGISLDKVRISINEAQMNEQRLEMIDRYEKLISDIERYQNRLDFLNSVLYSMNMYDRQMFLLKYEHGLSFQQIANRYYISKAGLFYRMNKALENVKGKNYD